jgi:DNA-binding PadR family transcriptional regulator
MIVQLLVLGVLKRRTVAHGYRIYRDLMEWRVETWTTVRPGSIYHAMTRLESQGFIKPAGNSFGRKLGPARTEYALTASGEVQFAALLEAALKSIDLEQLSGAIAFMELLPRARVIQLLQERATAQREVARFLSTLPNQSRPAQPSKHPELIRLWADNFTNAARSTEKLIASLTKGAYIFKNEQEGA